MIMIIRGPKHALRRCWAALALAGLVGLSGLACGGSKDGQSEAALVTPEPPKPPPGPIASDSQVEFAMHTANAGEVRLAEQGEAMASHPDVKGYATRMKNEHSQANTRLESLESQLALQPVPSDVSESLAAQADQSHSSLQSATSFDIAFLESQIAFLKSLLATLDTELIAKARDLRLRLELQNQRMEVENHLGVAQAVLDQLTGVAPAPPAAAP